MSTDRLPEMSRKLPRFDHSIRRAIDDAGFKWLGVTPAVTLGGFAALTEWIDRGYAADMDYIADRMEAYKHPRGVLEGCKTLVPMLLPYDASDHHPGTGGKVARYAWSGVDYHDVIHRRLKPIRQQILQHYSGANARIVVDTAPLMEREVAAAAGLGWRGKNTLLLNRRHGSYFFLACALLDIGLQAESPDDSFATIQPHGHCGTCTACLDACPTNAFVDANVLDARRCISYLTIEHRGPIELSLRDGIGDWIFGCDVCQEVCPWNRRRGANERQKVATDSMRIDPVTLFHLDDDAFRKRFRKTPLWRTRRQGMLRNAAIVIGNTRPVGGLAAIDVGLLDNDPVVRGTSVWALGKLGPRNLRERLTMMRQRERDTNVIEEIETLLSDSQAD